MIPAATPPKRSTRHDDSVTRYVPSCGRSLAVLAVTLAIVATACGSTSESSGPAPSQSSSVEPTTPLAGDVGVSMPQLTASGPTELTPASDPTDIPLPGVASTSEPLQSTTSTVGASSTTTPIGSSTTQQPTQTTTTAAQPAPPSAFPTSMAAIRGSEQILLIDTTTGASTVIAEFSLVVDVENQIGPQFPFSVDVDAAAVGLRYDTCCDVEASMTSYIDLQTENTSSPVPGAVPSVSPDGSALAVTHVSTIDVIDTASGSTTSLGRSDATWFLGRSSWNHDGSSLAIEVHTTAVGRPAIAVVPAGATSLDAATLLEPPQNVSWTLPSYRADGALVVVETAFAGESGTRIVAVDPTGTVIDTIGLADIHSILDIDHDVTGQWMLIVDGQGDAFWFGPGGAGRLPGSGYSSASW